MANVNPCSTIQSVAHRKDRAIAKADLREMKRPELFLVRSAVESQTKIVTPEEKKDPSGLHFFAPLKSILQKLIDISTGVTREENAEDLSQTELRDDGSISFPEDDSPVTLPEAGAEIPKVVKRPRRAANAKEEKARAKNARAKKARAKKAEKKAARERKLEAKQDLVSQDQSREKKQRRRFDHRAINNSH